MMLTVSAGVYTLRQESCDNLTLTSLILDGLTDAKQPMNSIRSGSVIILLAEDDENDAFLLVRAVKRAGIIGEVKRVRDGQETIDYLQAMDAAHRPNLLLLDLNMPRRSGFEVLTWLKERPALKQFPVVVLSSSTLDTDIQKARDLGAEGYEVKPNDFEGLVQIVSTLNERWLTREPVKLSAGLAQPDLRPANGELLYTNLR